MAAKKPPRSNDVVMEELLNKLGVKFEQTHFMNSPNVSAAYDAVERFQQPVPHNYNRLAFQLAWDWVSSIIHSTWKNSSILTTQEVIEKPNIQWKDKASGTPWSMAGIPDKETFNNDEECISWFEQQWTEKFWKCPCLSQVTVKKEILPGKKLKQNRLRNVMAVDASHNLGMQRCCYDCHHKMQKHPIDNLTALGWTPYRMGMQHLAQHLGKHPNGWEIDGGAWESHMFEACLEEIAKLKFQALKLEERTHDNWMRIRNLYRMISTIPIVMPDGNVYLKGASGSGGNLTGQVGTAHDNTLLMLFALSYSFILLAGPDYHQFRKETSIITFGDDGTFTVSDAIVGKFNGPAIAKLVWDDLGFVFESPNWEAQPFYKLGFLSMHFNFDQKRWVWTHVVNRDKLYSNLLQGGNVRDAADQLHRLCGMRNVAFGDEQMRNELQQIIDEWIHIFDDQLKGDAVWEQAKKSYVPDRLLDRVYFGFESEEMPQLSH